MVIAISGASGFLGSALVRAFSKRGDEIRPLVRRPAKSNSEISWNVERGTIDASRLEGVDAVINLAGESLFQRWSDDARRRIRDSRVHGTSLLARTLASLQNKPRVLLSGSAIGVYGSRGDEILDESSAPGDDFLASICKEWEAATESAAAAGIRVVYVRTGLPLHKSGGALEKMLLPFRLGVGGRLGSGRQWMSWISLEDYVALMQFCLDNGDIEGPVNFTGPAPVTNAELTKALGGVLSRPTFLPVPRVALEIALGKMADDTVLASQRVLPARAVAAGFRHAHETISAALRAALK